MVAVALLGRDDSCRAQLRQALQDLGATIVHEGGLVGADCAAIAGTRPSVVLVNLESGVEDALDVLDPLFEDPAINVVFNEAESTSQLSGWDLSRWARHLAAKVLGHSDTVPPPPAGAEALPFTSMLPEPGAPLTPAQEIGDVAIDRFAEEAANSEYAVPSSRELSQEPLAAAATPVMEDAATPEHPSAPQEPAVQALFEAPTAVDEAPLPSIARETDLHYGEVVPLDDAPVEVAVDRETHGGESAAGFDLDLDAIEDALAGLDGPSITTDATSTASLDAGLSLDDADFASDASGPSTAAGFDDGLAFESSLSLDSLPTPAQGAAAEPVSRLGGGDELGGLDLDFDLAPARTLGATEDEHELDLGLDADVAALAAQFDARAEQASPASSAGFDLQPFDDAADELAAAAAGNALPAEPVAASQATADAPTAPLARAASSFGELSLEPADEDLADGEAVAPPDAGATAGKPAGGYDFSSLSLSLEPLDGEAPVAVQGGEVAAGVDTGTLSLADGEGDSEGDPPDPTADAATLPRVILLGASIGGPDAVRTFLSSLPADFPALLLLCQHLDNGFFSRLAQQLAKVSKLPVRVADDGAGPARIGQVLVVPSSHRFRIDPEGEIEAMEHVEPPRYKPCIDDLMRDVADQFGRRVTAIIFSGMAGDAIEGAVHVTARGGEVWAQDPESCVVSSMVDGARARGVVEFVGSPRELAERCIQRYGRRR